MNKINFASQPARRRQVFNLSMSLLLFVAFLLMFFERERITSDTMALTNSLQQTNQKNVMTLPISENDIRRSDLAKSVYQDLTFPWQRLLTGIEAVKRDYKNVHYKTIAPVKSESAFLLTAQTSSVSEMLAFMTGLEANTTFRQIRLQTQHHDQERDLEFTVKIGWTP